VDELPNSVSRPQHGLLEHACEQASHHEKLSPSREVFEILNTFSSVAAAALPSVAMRFRNFGISDGVPAATANWRA
jgi:hypothetical protein